VSPSVAYLVSLYPALSHSFIRREVEALRKHGLRIHTFGIRRCAPAELLTAVDREAHATTTALLPAPPLPTAGAILAELGRRPAVLGALLPQALRASRASSRGSLYGLFYLAEAVLLARALRRRRLGHLHCHFANAGAEVGLLASRLAGIPFSLTLHGFSDFSRTSRERLAQLISAARFVACVSEHGRSIARSLVPAAQHDKIHLVRCGVDADAFAAAPRQLSPDQPLRLLHVARLAPEKQQRALLEAFAAARVQGLRAELRMVGEGPERPDLEERIRQLGLERHCQLLGARGGAALREEYARAHLFVLNSSAEGLPVVLMEAMAAGLSVVSPRVGGIPELVQAG